MVDASSTVDRTSHCGLASSIDQEEILAEKGEKNSVLFHHRPLSIITTVSSCHMFSESM